MDPAVAFQQQCTQDRDDDTLHLPTWTVDDWRRLFEHARPVSVAAGDVVIRHGERDRALYFVTSGALEVTSSASRHDALGTLSREHPGSVIGEISLFDGQPRTASVWAVKPTELLRLDVDDLHAFARENPARAHELLFGLSRVLALRLRRGEARRNR
jgi:CRP/FNR family transcriptional regulator, cyclic AMP receptor protein